MIYTFSAKNIKTISFYSMHQGPNVAEKIIALLNLEFRQQTTIAVITIDLEKKIHGYKVLS